MKNYIDNDYALNKHSDAIVYRFADQIVEITLAVFLAENPSKTEDDFRRWKELSDADYLDQDRSDYRQTWKNVPLTSIPDTELCAAPSPEEIIIDAQEESERMRKRAALGFEIWKSLTAIQRRRYYLHHVAELSTWEIARREGVNQSKIVNSLALAQSKIDKTLSKA